LLSWTTSNTWINLNWLSSSTYYRRVFAFDALDNTWWRSSWWDFVVQLDMIAPKLVFTGTTPSDWFIITGNNFSWQIQITETGAGLNQFIWIRSWVEYSLYDSGLKLMMNFDKLSSLWETDSNIVDISSSANIWSWYGWVSRTWNGKFGGAYELNTTDAHILPNGLTWIDLGTTHTLSAWLYAYNNTWTIFSETGEKYFLSYDATKLYYKDWISTSSVNYTLPKNQWRYVTVLRNWNSVAFYIDGIQQWTTQTLSSNNAMTLRYIGKQSPVWDSNAFKWKIDEPRAYNRALTLWEIQQLYYSNLKKYDIWEWLFSVNYQCLRDTTQIFNYGWYSNDHGSNSWTKSRNVTVSIPTYNFAGPKSLNIWHATIQWGTLSWQFTWYFQVEDWKGTTWWYTTLQLPIAMTGSAYGGAIPQSNIYIKWAWIDTIQWDSTPWIYVNEWLSAYTSFPWTQTYMKRDGIPNTCPWWVYGNRPYIKVEIPAYTKPDSYSGNFTYDLIY